MLWRVNKCIGNKEWSISSFGQVRDTCLLWNQHLHRMVRAADISSEVIKVEVAIENMNVAMFAQKLYQMRNEV